MIFARGVPMPLTCGWKMRSAPEVYNKRAWRRCRAAYTKSVGGLCERCLARGVVKAGVIVHHKVHLNEDNKNNPEVVYSFDNLELLCIECHNEEHMRKRRRYKIDETGAVFSTEI